MKKIIFISLLVCPLISFAFTTTAISSGSWSSPSTWSGATPPAAGDEAVIPSGFSVIVDISTPLILRLINNGTLIIANNSFSILNISENLYNNNNIFNEGKVFVHGSLFNIDTIEGVGAFCVWDTTSNTQYIGGTVDFCDITPPPFPPYVDINSGTVSGTVTFCQAGLCTPAVVKDVEQKNGVTISPSISSGIFKIKNAEYRHLKKVIVTDAGGRMIYNSDNNFSEIDLTLFVSGIYFYLCEDESQNIYTGKLMKE
jgi:hypothetical protein